MNYNRISYIFSNNVVINTQETGKKIKEKKGNFLGKRYEPPSISRREERGCFDNPECLLWSQKGLLLDASCEKGKRTVVPQ